MILFFKDRHSKIIQLKFRCFPLSRLPDDFYHQRSPTTSIASPKDDAGQERAFTPPRPAGPEPPVPGPDRLHLVGGLRPQDGRGELPSADLPFPTEMHIYHRYIPELYLIV